MRNSGESFVKVKPNTNTKSERQNRQMIKKERMTELEPIGKINNQFYE